MKTAFAYGATLLCLIVLDIAWLMLVAVEQFQRQLGPMLQPRPSLAPAIALYLILAGGIVLLVVLPALQAGSWSQAMIYGAVLGLCAYATFDLTCLAILKGYTLALALTDMAWGTVLCGLAALAGYAAASWAAGTA